MSAKPNNQVEFNTEDESTLTWYATFKDEAMEAAFNDYNWKAVYARYRLLFVVMTVLISLMTLIEVVNTKDIMRIVREGGSWIVVIIGLYSIRNKAFFKLNHDRITMVILCLGCIGTTYGMSQRDPSIMHEWELPLGLMTLILCYIVFPFNLVMGTMMALVWVGCHIFTFLGMPMLGLLEVPASAEAKMNALIITFVGWLALFSYHRASEKGKRIRFAQMNLLNIQKEKIHQTFNKYMGGAVAETILSNDFNTEGEDRWVTILFTDLKGYSTISQPMSPKEVLSMLNEYFSEMVPIIEKHDGVVLEYIGDAMMIVFGAPKNVERHQEKAVRCAMEMREHLKVLNARWDEQELSRYWKNQDIDYLDARAGIHTGNIVAGNIGADKVMKYGAIGDVVNIAARLEQANKPIGSTILFSRSVYVALTKSIVEQCKDEGSLPLKGRSGEENITIELEASPDWELGDVAEPFAECEESGLYRHSWTFHAWGSYVVQVEAPEKTEIWLGSLMVFDI